MRDFADAVLPTLMMFTSVLQMCQPNCIHFYRQSIAVYSSKFRQRKKITNFEVTAMRVAGFVLGLLTIIRVLLSSGDQLYIRPSEEAPCPGESCYLLSHVLRNAREFLTSNAVAILTPGNYIVNENTMVYIFNVSNLTLMGSISEDTVVNCSKQFFLSTHSADLVISNLNFFNCTHTEVTVLAVDSMMTLINTSFNNSTGSCIVAVDSSLNFLGRTAFNGNQCFFGCGIYAVASNIVFRGAVVFQDNTCEEGCGIYAEGNTNILFCESVVFEGNQAVMDGSGISAVYNCDLSFLDKVVFQNNTCRFGCGIFAFESCEISFNSSAIFESNKAVYYGGGAMITHNSALKFRSSALFHNNQAAYGGALYLHVEENEVLFLNSAEINITANYASQFGGGIYILNSPSIRSLLLSKPLYNVDGSCFYHCMDEQACPNIHCQGNKANVVGHMIYGDFHQCYIYSNDMNISTIVPYHNESDIASDPTRVCFCINATPNCSEESLNRSVYPGEAFEIPVVVVGNSLGATTGTVFTVLLSNGSLAEAQTSQVLQLPSCTNLNYTVYSHPGTVSMQLVTNIPTIQFGLQKTRVETLLHEGMNDFYYHRRINLPIYLNLELLPCPNGFQFQITTKTCVCNQVLQNHDINNCNIDNETVHRPNPNWISASDSGNTIVHDYCPLDYCVPDNVPINISNPDEQCQFGHSGTLCGGCRANLSIVIGSSRCLPCTNWWLFLIPLFALIGMILVILLTVLNLTVSVGTINGLIFYANIIGANMSVFFPITLSTNVLAPRVFIAWLNLDLGIEICFYNGLDTYAKTWLQLVFPVYVWIIVTVIIISSHYSTWAAKLSGKNSVQVLATLFLLSYAKLLRIIIAAFSFTELKTYHSENVNSFSVENVWLYDGNIEYLKGKHIPLFLLALVILVGLYVPYTLILTFIQCLQQQSGNRVLFWVRRLKPFFDAYTGPYKDRHRYWTGLLLLVRVGLFLFFSVIQNLVNQPTLSLLAIVVVAVSLLFFQGMVGGVYKLVYLNFLESFFLVNLICFSCATLYTTLAGENEAVSIYITVGLAFVVLVVTVAHGTYKSLRDSQYLKSLVRKKRFTHVAWPAATDGDEQDHNAQTQAQPTTSEVFIELREPWIEHCD